MIRHVNCSLSSKEITIIDKAAKVQATLLPWIKASLLDWEANGFKLDAALTASAHAHALFEGTAKFKHIYVEAVGFCFVYMSKIKPLSPDHLHSDFVEAVRDLPLERNSEDTKEVTLEYLLVF